MEAETKGEGETLARHEHIFLELANKKGLRIGKIYREIVSGETITSNLSDFSDLGDQTEFYITLEENNSEEQEVLVRYEEMEQAMIDRDMDKLNEIILDGTTFTHMSGMTQSKEEYLRDIKNEELDYQEYRIENPSVTIKGDEAIIEARVYLTANAYGAQGTYPFDIQSHFQRINGEWFFGSK